MRFATKKFFVLAIALSFFTATVLFATTATSAASTSGDQQKEKPQDKKPTQQKPEDDDDKNPLKIGTDLVLLDVSVVDTSNNIAVMDLAKKDFQVFEDKAPQQIEFFSKEQVPVSVVFTIDTSGSMRGKLDTVITACVSLVKDSKPGDENAVIEFKESPELLEEFTTDTQSVIDTLESLVARSQTSMLDAIYLASEEARTHGKNRRKALIVVTDGLDKENYYKFEDVVKQVQESDVQIYMIGFTQDLDESSGLFKRSQKGKAEQLLSKLATETGGRAFFPKELADVHKIGQQISSDLRTQYAIGYYPTNTKRDGTFRTVKVSVNSPSNKRLVARTRTGYYATSGETPTAKSKP